MLVEKANEPKKTIERKKYLQIINLLKEFISVITIFKCILDLRINFIADELLILTLTIEK